MRHFQKYMSLFESTALSFYGPYVCTLIGTDSLGLPPEAGRRPPFGGVSPAGQEGPVGIRHPVAPQPAHGQRAGEDLEAGRVDLHGWLVVATSEQSHSLWLRKVDKSHMLCRLHIINIINNTHCACYTSWTSYVTHMNIIHNSHHACYTSWTSCITHIVHATHHEHHTSHTSCMLHIMNIMHHT